MREPALGIGKEFNLWCASLFLVTLLGGLVAPRLVSAQPPTKPPLESPNAPQPPAPEQAGKGNPTPAETVDSQTPPGKPELVFEAEEDNFFHPNGDIRGSGKVKVTYPGVTITADRVQGNLNREVTFTGHAKLVAKGATTYADSIHFYPRLRAYRLENPRGILEPSFFRDQIMHSVLLKGGNVFGDKNGYTRAQNSDATTCEFLDPHYELRIRYAELIPDDKLILKRVGVYFFGHRLLVLPTLIIPLNREQQRRPRTDYLPEFGRNLQEGYYARFPYVFAIGSAAATLLRVDLTQLRGPGYRIEQEYLAGRQSSAYDTSFANLSSGGGFNFTGGGNQGSYITASGYGSTGRLPRLGNGLGPTSGGLFTMQGYLKDGFDRNFSTSFRHQQGIGSNNNILFSTEFQNNSFYTFSDQSNFTNRLAFNHSDNAHGVMADLSLNSSKTTNGNGFETDQLTASLKQTFTLGSYNTTRSSLSYGLDFSQYSSISGVTTNHSSRLNSQFQFNQTGRDYTLGLQANKSMPIGTQSGNGGFGTLERLPELTFQTDTTNYRGGLLRKLPMRFEMGYGQFSEPGSQVQTDRILMALNVQDYQIMRGNTEMTMGGGFEQRYYGDSAAQYVLRNSMRLRQHLGGRSGFDLGYQYQEPAGGTPFLFDTFSRIHFLSAEGGYLSDNHFQLTVRAGYDFLGTSSLRPWQSVSGRMMWRPNLHTRFDVLATFDPNTGKFFSLTKSLKLRGRQNFGMDLVARYDPGQGKYSQLNSQFDVPFGRGWRVSGILRYNGFRGQLESTNLQVIKAWDCMEMSLTYVDTPLAFVNSQQFYLSFRLTALPFNRRMSTGPAGDAIGTGLGEFY